jgi:hypothetical protein
MFKKQEYRKPIILFIFVVFILGCSGGGGGSSSSNTDNSTETTSLEDITVPDGFNFLTTKTVDVTIQAADHGLSSDAYVKIAIDAEYQYMLFIGPLEDNSDFNMQFTVPSRTSKLYYKVYKSGTEPFESELTL